VKTKIKADVVVDAAEVSGSGDVDSNVRRLKCHLPTATQVMPEISRFLGIVIRMYYRDHAPPHFHAEYGEYEITVEIGSGLVEGRFPKRALAAVLDCYAQHVSELADNWELARQEQRLNKIDPLE